MDPAETVNKPNAWTRLAWERRGFRSAPKLEQSNVVGGFRLQHPTLQVSEMVAFGDLKVAGGDLLEGPGILHVYDSGASVGTVCTTHDVESLSSLKTCQDSGLLYIQACV